MLELGKQTQRVAVTFSGLHSPGPMLLVLQLLLFPLNHLLSVGLAHSSISSPTGHDTLCATTSGKGTISVSGKLPLT